MTYLVLFAKGCFIFVAGVFVLFSAFALVILMAVMFNKMMDWLAGGEGK